MRTFPKIDEPSGRTVGFEIESVYVSPATCARILSTVEGVSQVQKRRLFSTWDEIHVRFRFHAAECVVWEPFGDNSRYWIGQKNTPDLADIGTIEEAFRNYRLPRHRRVIGDIVSVRFLKNFSGRGAD